MKKLKLFMLVTIANVTLCQISHEDESDTPIDNSSYSSTPDSTEECIRLCPATSEYNPVCGSDRKTYFNPGRLICATECGLDVFKLGPAPCSMYDDTTERVGVSGSVISGPEEALDKS